MTFKVPSSPNLSVILSVIGAAAYLAACWPGVTPRHVPSAVPCCSLGHANPRAGGQGWLATQHVLSQGRTRWCCRGRERLQEGEARPGSAGAAQGTGLHPWDAQHLWASRDKGRGLSTASREPGSAGLHHLQEQ